MPVIYVGITPDESAWDRSNTKSIFRAPRQVFLAFSKGFLTWLLQVCVSLIFLTIESALMCLEFSFFWSSGFDGLYDLSPSTSACWSEATFVYGRSKCREGVTEIGSGQNDGRFIAQFINVICTVSVENIHCLPIAQDNSNNEALAARTRSC